MKLREYHPRDFDALWRIDQQCFATGIAYSRAELASYINRRGAFTLLMEEDDKNIAAFLVAEADPAKIGHILTIDVLPDHQRKRLGTHLLEAAEARLESLGCRSLLLEVAVDNRAAIAFYKRHGFDVIETIPRYYQDSLDALLMGKRLGKQKPSLRCLSSAPK